ncbi:MAG: acetyl-CoA carboxylase biotin carboxyl carrier protein [Rhodobacteraceae bacterium]|nr:acetyl-CoA carboxylase biotin carboxyl carrier protein [Paracoccaceae bacterium]
MHRKTHDEDVGFIRALAALLRENDLTELQVKRKYADADRLCVRVSRQGSKVTATAALLPAASTAPADPSPAEVPAADPAQNPNAVTSPMVGTVYLQPEPGTPPFVSVADKVREGQTLLIIEAMKMMNQIPSPCAGTVKRILVEDGAPVEFGAPLMIIE